MTHDQIISQIEKLPLKERIAVLAEAIRRVEKRQQASDKQKKLATQRLVKNLKKNSVKFPKGFKFNRDEANAR